MEKIIEYGSSGGPCLRAEDYNRVIEYLKEKIKEKNIIFDRLIGTYNIASSYAQRTTSRIENSNYYSEPIEIKGIVFYYNMYFLFLGRNEEGELSIYQCGCTAEGYKEGPIGLTEDIFSSLGRIYDIKIENLLPPTFCFIKDILSEEVGWDKIEIIDQPDSGYISDFQYIKLECDKNNAQSRWACTKAYDIWNFIEANNELLIRPLDTDPDDQLDETPYIKTNAGMHNKTCIKNIRELVKKASKANGVFPTYSYYSVIYKDDNILVFRINDKCYLVNDPEVIKAGIEEHIFSHNNCPLEDDIDVISPFKYTGDNEYFKSKNTSTCITIYGDINNPTKAEQLYGVKTKNNKCFVLGAGPLVTDPKTNKSNRLIYTIKQK